ncbi:hypothetical protein [Paenibacillus sp. GYB003]|uniref:hypothetical protein n=1 Tax=Paenibacillus sp. GYB003 TaxID=2994392 RepID=UPI002F963FE2
MGVAIELNENKFEEAFNKVKPEADIKFHSNHSRRIWSYLRDNGWLFFGVVRNWTSVFKECDSDQYLVIHHFIQDYPDMRLVERSLCIEWNQIIDQYSTIGQIILKIHDEGFRIMIPVQAFMDAYLQEVRRVLRQLEEEEEL